MALQDIFNPGGHSLIVFALCMQFRSMFFLSGDSVDEMTYVDLLLNPERYTGYSGPSALRVWSSIYKENCFRFVYMAMLHNLHAPVNPSGVPYARHVLQ